MCWVNDGGQSIGRAELLLRIVVVVHTAHVDSSAIEELAIATHQAIAAAMSSLIAKPGDPLESIGTAVGGAERSQFVAKVGLQLFAESAGARGMSGLRVQARHGIRIRA